MSLRHARDGVVEIPFEQPSMPPTLSRSASVSDSLALARFIASRYTSPQAILQQDRVEPDLRQHVHQTDDESLIELNVGGHQRRDDRLPGAEGCQRVQPVLIGQDVRERVRNSSSSAR